MDTQAFLYVRRALQELLENPVPGWFGRRDPFAFERVAPGHENALLGTFRTDRQVDCIEHQAQ